LGLEKNKEFAKENYLIPPLGNCACIALPTASIQSPPTRPSKGGLKNKHHQYNISLLYFSFTSLSNLWDEIQG